MTNVIQIIEAPRMSVRIIEARPAYLGYIVQYEYAREGRPKLYGGVQTQIWANVRSRNADGTTIYRDLKSARAAARRVVSRNNG